MPELIIRIKDKIAKPLNNCVICDNSDYTVKFIFDEEWENEPLRIARFIWNKQYVDVQFTGDTCEVPIVSKTNNLAIGVYAGDLRTTTPAILTCYTSILSEDVIEHSVTPSEYEEIMKLLNAQATDIAALKAVDKRIWTNLDTINKTASAAKVKAEEGVAKADDALTATRTNTSNINSLQTDVNALKAVDERLWASLDTINKTASTAKLKAEEGVAKADSALARNIFTDEEKAKLASITNPIIIKGRVDTVNDLPTEAVIGWFYFVGLESASSYEEYCYSENGWEYIGLSQEGVDLSNYYTKKQIDTTINELKAIDNSLGTRIDNVDSKASAAKIKAEEGVAKADNALTKASSNTTNINSLQTNVNALKTNVKALEATDERIWTNLDTINKTASTAKLKAEEGVAKADDALTATRTNATNISTHETRLDSIDNTLSSHDTRITTAQQKANSVDEKVDSTNEVIGQLSTSLQSAYNKINAHANDIAINRTTLGTQCKNLLKNTAVTTTKSGITFTVNNDKSITVSGTATSRIIFLVGTAYISQTGNYTYTGTPSGGAASTYSMNYRNSNTYKTVETGNGITTQFEGGKTYEAVIDIRSGVTISNLTFSPMLRDADIVDDTYEPYSDSVDERLIEDKSNIAINKTTLGYRCKNLLNNTASTTTVNNVTFTVNSDGSITATQTTTSSGNATIKVATMTLKPGTYILTGDDEIRSSGFGAIRFYVGSTIYSSNKPYTFDTEVTINVRLFIWQGVNINGSKTIYPMLRYADITDSTYEPYKESVDDRIIQNKSNIALNKSTLGYQRKNILNETGYLSSITSVSIGTFNISGNSITLTATGKDCYTKPHTSSDGGYRIPVEPDTDYILSWESDNTYAGLVYVFMNGNVSQQKLANNKDTKYFKFTTNSDTTFITIRLGVATSGNSITYSNIMLRYADITDDTYEPYKESVDDRITQNKSDIAVNKTTLGYQCKNLLKNTASTKTVSGITFTVNDDKSVTANGTNSTSNYANIIVFKRELEVGTYTLTGAISDAFRIRLGMGTSADGYGIYVGVDKGNGYTFTVAEKALYTVTCQVESGKTASNVIFKPMIRDAEITDDTYEPYQPSLVERCLLKDTAGINLGHAQSSSITIDNLSSYTALWVNVSGGVSGINFQTNLIVPIAYLAKSSSNRVPLAGGIPSSAYIASGGVLAAKDMNGTITAKVNGNTLDLTISDGTIGGIEVISLM